MPNLKHRLMITEHYNINTLYSRRNIKTFYKISIATIVAINLAIFLTGCSGGVNGEGTSSYSQSFNTPVVRGNSFINEGWAYFTKGQYESAIRTFQKVLEDNPTPQESADANNGIGWAKSRIGKLEDGMPWFEKAYSLSDDAKVGLAAAYVQKGSKSDLENAAKILAVDLGKNNPHFKFEAKYPIGVTNAEVHALLAYIYAAIGKNEEALDQMNYAKELNPNYAGTTIEQIDRIVSFILR